MLDRINGFLAEAAVAELISRRDLDGALWMGGRNRGWDVAGAGLNVDAKAAFVQTKVVDEQPEVCLGFMGSPARSTGAEAREGVTYALVLLQYEDVDGLQTSALAPTIRLDATVRYAVFGFNTAEINALFRRPWLKDRSRRRLGGNLYLPLRQALGSGHLWPGSAAVIPDGELAPADSSVSTPA
ncbi:hypothetical protein [Cellulosimicrobium cellulans]|uniref:hypothetical protein n=1 Tax=Cellulosimicrobium cellulans TaxID=1710 RepID=UPI001BA47068|nr:hypothetical protein [Cellulosimicrobium cellulans]QUC00626.1 hypothetical protein J5A69_05190 [Cellulosimicrobium cellulans]